MESLKLTTAALSTIVAAVTLAQPKDSTHEEVDIPQEAVVRLLPTQDSRVHGLLVLRQQDDGVQVVGRVIGLEPGDHGFHIHEFGDLRDPQGKSAGGHFNPDGKKHGGPDADEHHAGDLGNITAGSDGTASVDKLAKDLKLHFVIGRSVVVHGNADDFESQPSGDAGPRVSVGVIGFAEVKDPQTGGIE
ncbi:MAG: superoxide dismutase family protein [Planctomycetaceae bacterium]|nr:superoxide dismutase family protein [Planctomycetaceae bacterium]